MASVAFTSYFLSVSRKRQKPTRMPYSCHAQFGRSGCSGFQKGGDRTVRGMLLSIDHSSTLTMVQTAIRAPSGSLSGGRDAVWGIRYAEHTTYTPSPAG